MKKIFNRFGFSETEGKVITFILAMTFVGISSSYVKIYLNDEEPENFDYSVQDSLFNAAGEEDSEVDVQKLEDKKVDSKQELLDFSASKNISKKADISSLIEKSINMNSAGIEEFTSLPGIGLSTAEKIIELRNKKGRFIKITDLLDVKGIGKSKFERIEKYLFIE
ncbi:MAG: helix-hairpin-helix domain-containing protein [Bacteroidetes bacterium]|nr:helix-hairpin-helix domain-containing protein [Bacteroidota bacterium]MBU1680809.1 helix-hairpin-helix domain-containing protein [Bacteroidota bacterium]